MQQVRKLAVGLAVLAGAVGVGAGLAGAQTDGTTPPTTEAPAAEEPTTPPEAPADAPEGRDRDCPHKGEGDGRPEVDAETGGGTPNAGTGLRVRAL